MKYLKLYESFNLPKLGDYAICIKPEDVIITSKASGDDIIIISFIENTIGIISNIKGGEEEYDEPIFPYTVYYDMPEDNEEVIKAFKMFFSDSQELDFNKSEIMWDSDLETLKMKIETKKYNI